MSCNRCSKYLFCDSPLTIPTLFASLPLLLPVECAVRQTADLQPPWGKLGKVVVADKRNVNANSLNILCQNVCEGYAHSYLKLFNLKYAQVLKTF